MERGGACVAPERTGAAQTPSPPLPHPAVIMQSALIMHEQPVLP
jgi:hypothetical protein